ncbi:winged helix-turn-helix domain-containing protein [Stutzerimonas nitrititolerans]|uniref:winged helix-turn-helix domain-containing protein n=1 Tax=Stutzerimonas nitrititolerans TaxID=2482751 RepID=UPI0028A1899B|nr:winged helix-turn-helix domain-containing protein [Stutzerimonas nitrititolerans]
MTSSTPPQATDAFICPFLKTGRDGCSARFDRALFQLVISDEQEKILDLGFSGSRVLEKLLQAPGEVVSREELMSYAWEGRVVGQGSLNQQIYTLRQALFDDSNQIIQTLPRRGYLFNPQYLHDMEQARTPPVEAPAVRRTVVIELPTPGARPVMNPVPLRHPRPLRRKVLLAGIGLPLLAGLTALGVHLGKQASEPFLTHNRQIKELDVLYVETNQPLLDSLIRETGSLIRSLSAMSAQPTRLIVSMTPGFYEIRCLRRNGGVNWLKVQKEQIRAVATEHLRECLK